MAVTLKQISQESGYSVTTVSRALGGFDDVNEQTRSRIIAIADRLGYEPNHSARQLQSQKTNTLGFVVPEFLPEQDDDFFSLLLHGIGYATSQNDFDLLLSTQKDYRDLAVYRRLVNGRRVDGMIVARTYHDDPRIRFLQERNHPFVVSGRLSPDMESTFSYVDADSQQGILQLVEHFISYGHRHIAIILPPDNLAYTPYRLQGYLDALTIQDIPHRDHYIYAGAMNRQSGYDVTQEILSNHADVTAIVACNDMMALGAMDAIRAQESEVGQDIAVGGFDDIPIAKYTLPSLTTVRQPIFDIGVMLAQMLIEKIASGSQEITKQLVVPELMIRDSSGNSRV